MRTQKMIMLIVLTVLLAVALAVLGAVWWLGAGPGAMVVAVAVAVLLLVFVRVVRPWYICWGATDEEAAMTMPGDDLIRGASSATRAITIAAQPEDVWPWLLQLGFGKAGWYSYDWIDNDGHPSADRILPEYQTLLVGDRILMMPEMGFSVVSIDPGRSIVSVLEDGTTSWCLGLYAQEPSGTRLLSRWRPKGLGLATLLVEPGSFIMGQKMLRGIRDRAERTARARAG